MASTFSETHRLVHLDLKGAPPRVEYLEQVIPLFSSWGATGILIEYEDMLPFADQLTHLRSPSCYTIEDIERIKTISTSCNLIIIPLIQTFGHLEFVLKHDQHRHLREIDKYPNAICPLRPESFDIVSLLIENVMKMHPKAEHIHIGADEVWHLGKCEKCLSKMAKNGWEPKHIFLDTIKTRCKWIKEKYPKINIIMWDDMLRNVSISMLKEYDINSYIQPMIWNYEHSFENLPVDIFDRYASVFDNLWAASAFKGATGCAQYLPIIEHHIINQLAWIKTLHVNIHKFKCIKGIALTGWQRYDHYSILCELLPASLPSLCLCLKTLINGSFTKDVHEESSRAMGFSTAINIKPFPRPQPIEDCVKFPGSDVFVGVQRWSNSFQKYQTICISQTMVGWFSDYFKRRNFTNPAQLETIFYPLTELINELSQLRERFIISLNQCFYSDTTEEWMECYFNPLIIKIENILKDCNKQMAIGGRIKDYGNKTLK